MTIATHRFNNALRYGDGDHPRQWHLTPDHVLALVRTDLGGKIDLDPCTFADNPTEAVNFYTAEDDGLSKPWWPKLSVFVNPPYGKAREPWVSRCIYAARAHGSKVILLIPAATDTRTFMRAASTSTAIVFIQARLKFGSLRDNRRQHTASHPSVLIGWNTDLAACSTLGLKMVLP